MENPAFDPNVTMRWVRGVLQEPDATARAYRDTAAPWKTTFVHVTLPVYVTAFIGGWILSWIFGGSFMLGAVAAAPLFALLALAWNLALMFVAAFIFDFFAGMFEGRRNYDAAFAAVSLAAVPGALGGMLGPLPWIGWVIALAAGIYSLVLLYRFVPVFLTVPEPKRVAHFVVSLLVAFVVNLVVSGILAAALVSSTVEPSSREAPETSGDGSYGMFGGLERQADFAAQAAEDRYEPPADGQLTEAQVATYARNLERTAELRQRLSAKYENLDEETASISDIFSGVGDAVRLGTAEMEVVKGAGGNWAEHQWVKSQLETARVQRDGSAAIEHNYELFLEYRDRIEPYDH